MKNLKLFFFLFLFSTSFVKAQDSVKVFNHEIGFNTVSLVKQLISNNPSSTLNQLPYDIFYNLYFKDIVGYRFGLGLSTTNSETAIEGQNQPRTTKDVNLNMRFGLSWNFVKSRRLTLNAFGDFLYAKNTQEAVNTQTTVPVFGDPTTTITTTTNDKLTGTGFQAGIGVKYNLYRHLSLYIEVPIGFMVQKTTSSVLIEEPNVLSKTTTATDKTTLTRITIPTTVYLVLRF